MFTTSTIANVDSLFVYDQNGKINSFSFQNDVEGYGSFFLNAILYVGTIQYSIYPVLLNVNTTQLGSGIQFWSSSFTDMTSCQRKELITSVSEHSTSLLNIFPNPINGNFSFDLGENQQIINVTITDLSGKIIQSNEYNNSKLLNLKLEGSAVVYFIRVESESLNEVIRLVKE